MLICFSLFQSLKFFAYQREQAISDLKLKLVFLENFLHLESFEFFPWLFELGQIEHDKHMEGNLCISSWHL